MGLETRDAPFEVHLSGASSPHDPAKPYSVEIRPLLDHVWGLIRSRKLPHKGINWVVYDAGASVFAGVELVATDARESGLEPRTIRFHRYAVWKHIGSYDKLGDAYAGMKREMAARRLAAGQPFIEKYGHWTDDVTKLETDLICPLV